MSNVSVTGFLLPLCCRVSPFSPRWGSLCLSAIVFPRLSVNEFLMSLRYGVPPVSMLTGSSCLSAIGSSHLSAVSSRLSAIGFSLSLCHRVTPGFLLAFHPVSEVYLTFSLSFYILHNSSVISLSITFLSLYGCICLHPLVCPIIEF
jgi:hypothetical protein